MAGAECVWAWTAAVVHSLLCQNTDQSIAPPPPLRPDITKAKTMLGWEPKVVLREGLQHMVADFKARLGVA